MERKIGGIFEYKGEWYQCIRSSDCPKCDLKSIRYCRHKFPCESLQRTDCEEVIFKKLEKVGEPFERNGYMYQEYKAHTYPLLMSGDAKIPTDNGFAVIIKKNKEDMEEKNLKPFDLQAAKSGKPVRTRDGRKARVICFDAINYRCQPIIALVTNFDGNEAIETYCLNGRFNNDIADISDYDLMMAPRRKEGWVNVYRDNFGLNCSIIYDNKDIALSRIDINEEDTVYIDTVKISWEE